MATIHNTDLSKELRDGAKLQQLRDRIPSELAEKVVPVMEVNPKLFRRVDFVSSITKSTTGNSVLVNTSTFPNRDYFLTNINVAWNFDALSVATTFELRCVINGANNIIRFPLTNLSVFQDNVSIVLPFPIKLDRNSATACVIALTTTAGTYSVTASVSGYTVEGTA